MDRTVCLYGYMRGAHLRLESKVHIMGELLIFRERIPLIKLVILLMLKNLVVFFWLTM